MFLYDFHAFRYVKIFPFLLFKELKYTQQLLNSEHNVDEGLSLSFSTNMKSIAITLNIL